jgi:hypothetical protein
MSSTETKEKVREEIPGPPPVSNTLEAKVTFCSD